MPSLNGYQPRSGMTPTAEDAPQPQPQGGGPPDNLVSLADRRGNPAAGAVASQDISRQAAAAMAAGQHEAAAVGFVAGPAAAIKGLPKEMQDGPAAQGVARALMPEPAYPAEGDVFDREGLSYGSGMEGFMHGGIVAQEFHGPSKSMGTFTEASQITAARNFTDLLLHGDQPGAVGLRLRFAHDDETGAAYARALSAVHRAPVAALGFDPRHIVVSTTENRPTASGQYVPAAGYTQERAGRTAEGGYPTWVSLHSPSAFVHESFHGGLTTLLASPDVPASVKAKLRSVDEESLVRAFMLKHFGGVEVQEGMGFTQTLGQGAAAYSTGPGGQQVAQGRDVLTRAHDVLDLADKWAERLVAKRQPGGPR